MDSFITEYGNYIRVACFLGCFAIFVAWERRNPWRMHLQDILHRYSQHALLLVGSTIFVRLILSFTTVGIAAQGYQQKVGMLYSLNLPFILLAIISVVLLDLAIYLQHRIFHKVSFFWSMHKLHHIDKELDVSTGLRFHPLESLFSLAFKFIVILLIGAPVISVIIFEILLNLSAMFTHANVSMDSKLERMLRKFIVTPAMHRVHHSELENEQLSNYGFGLSIWDRLFKSYRAKSLHGEELIFGVEGYRHAKFDNMWAWLRLPFNQKDLRMTKPKLPKTHLQTGEE